MGCRRTRAWFAALLVAAACHRSDPGDQCSSNAQCATGSYCSAGMCHSDCTVSADCSGGAVCTPEGQCVTQDNLYCEEGPAPVPAQYSTALALKNPFLLQDVIDCSQMGPINPDDVTDVDLIEATFRACDDVTSFQTATGLLMLGEMGQCRPALIASDHILWHALPLSLFYVFNSPDQVDTVMEARVDGDTIEYVAGSPPDGVLDNPVPGRIWASGSGRADGTLLQAQYQSQPLLSEVLRFDPDGGPDVLDSFAEVHAERTVEPDGGAVVDVAYAQFTSSSFTPDMAAQMWRDGDHITVRPRSLSDAGTHYSFQLSPQFDGRYDDESDGGVRSICWTAIADAGEQITYWKNADHSFGKESDCLYPEGTP